MTVDLVAAAEPRSLTRVVHSVGSQFVSVAVTGGLGLVFWLVAARLYAPAEFGRDALLLTVMQTVAAASDLNLNSSLPRLIPQLGVGRTRFVLRAGLASAAVGATLTSGFVVVAPLVSPAFRFVGQESLGSTILIGSVVVWGVFTLQNSLLVTVRRAALLPVLSSAFSIGKLALLLAFAGTGVPHPVLVAWVIPAILVTVPVVLLPVRRGLRTLATQTPLRFGGVTPDRPAVMSFLACDYGALLLQQVAVILLPLLITSFLGPVANATFAVGFVCVLAIDTVLLGAGNALIAEAAAEPSGATALARESTARLVRLLVPAAVGGALCAPLILRAFGGEYATSAAGPLRLLLLAVLPQAVLTLRIVLWRLDGQARPILVTQGAVLAALVPLLAGTLGPLGVTGAALSWLGAHCVVALGVLPSLYARLSLTTVRSGGS